MSADCWSPLILSIAGQGGCNGSKWPEAHHHVTLSCITPSYTLVGDGMITLLKIL